MCGRFALYSDSATLRQFLGCAIHFDWLPRFNIAPTQKTPVYLLEENGAASLRLLQWGLVPFWAKDKTMAGKMINARSETILEKPSFKGPFKNKRCLVPANGFYEWHTEGKSKTPYYITQPNSIPWMFAGIWDRNEKISDTPLESFSILTTQANQNISHLHQRMPLVIPKEKWGEWLTSPEPEIKLPEFLVQAESTCFHLQKVTSIVNKVIVDSPECIKPPPKGLFD